MHIFTLGDLHYSNISMTDSDGDEITMDGTMQLCEDLGVNPDEDCVLYAIAFELKSPRMGEWNKKGWTDGWKSLG